MNEIDKLNEIILDKKQRHAYFVAKLIMSCDGNEIYEEKSCEKN